MAKKKRSTKKKKTGRGGGGGNKTAALSSGGAADGGVVESPQQPPSTNNVNVADVPSLREDAPPISDEEYVRMMMTLPRGDQRAMDEDRTGREEMRCVMNFLGASAQMCRSNPAFADRLIGELMRMGRNSSAEEEKHECWICLSDEVDESGRPAVRDCSCRGDGLGYAHVSCLKSYAKRAALDTNESVSDKLLPPDELREFRKFNVHFEKCSICCQAYQHDLANEMADALLDFIAEQFSSGPPITSYKLPSLGPEHNEMYIDASRIKIGAIITMNYDTSEAVRKEGEDTARKMLAMAYTENDPHPITIALGLKKIGFFLGASKSTYKEGIKFYERAISQYKLIGRESSIAIAKSNIERIRIEHEGQPGLSAENNLKNEYDAYQYFMTAEGYGEESMMGLKAGLRYAETLVKTGHGIEAERLSTKTVAMCDRIIGKEHDLTGGGRRVMNFCKARRVELPEGQGVAVALCYEDNGRKIIVQNLEDCCMEGSPMGVIFSNGTPVEVVCHSLENPAAHLNGKIGDARDYNKESRRYTIHFEDKSLEPVAIKQENLRILFELPDIDKSR